MIKNQLEEIFQPLVGPQISRMWRFLSSQSFDFGTQEYVANRRGKKRWRANNTLIVSWFWEIAGEQGHIVGSDDFGPGLERRDSDEAMALYRLMDRDRIWIQNVEGRDDEGFQLYSHSAPTPFG